MTNDKGHLPGSRPLIPDAPLPSRRVVLLGASNLTRSFATVVETALGTWQQPVDFMVAMGHGRSYVQDSRVWARKISGIFSCGLWTHLEARSPLPTAALVTDIGNDLLYGVPVDRVFERVEACVERLAELDAVTVVTRLPLGSLERLGEARFQFFRRLLFPQSRLTLAAIRRLAGALDTRLGELTKWPNTSVISASPDWYGFDPIHLRRRVWRTAWPTLLSAWRAPDQPLVTPRPTLWRAAYLAALAPWEDTWFGISRRSRQPSGMLRDGTTLSLY